MRFRLSPFWWPVLAVAAPVLVPKLIARNRRFRENRQRADEFNRARMQEAKPLEIPQVEFLELVVLVEEKVEDGFLGAAGVSYLLKTDRGSMLFDVAFGPVESTLAHNVAKLGLDLGDVDALAISHLHPDHMGGVEAHRTNRVAVPHELAVPRGLRCFLPDMAEAPGFNAEVVEGLRILAAGIATTGPLARQPVLPGMVSGAVVDRPGAKQGPGGDLRLRPPDHRGDPANGPPPVARTAACHRRWAALPRDGKPLSPLRNPAADALRNGQTAVEANHRRRPEPNDPCDQRGEPEPSLALGPR